MLKRLKNLYLKASGSLFNRNHAQLDLLSRTTRNGNILIFIWIILCISVGFIILFTLTR